MDSETLTALGSGSGSGVVIYYVLKTLYDKKISDLTTTLSKAHSRIDSLKQEHEDERVKVAKEYVSKRDMEKLEERLEKRMEMSENNIITAVRSNQA